MTSIHTMRTLAAQGFSCAVQAASPYLSLQAALANKPLPQPDGGRYIIIAVGKAACPMMEGMLEKIPEKADVTALAVTNYENQRPLEGCTVIGSGHPVPDNNGLIAGQKVIELLSAATKDDLVIALISGGGSALLPAPVSGISLNDKIHVNNCLLAHGVDIHQINLVRQHLSRLKGGGFSRLASPASVFSFILSDVIGNDLATIASGPTATMIGSRAEAFHFLKNSIFSDQIPENVLEYLASPEQASTPGENRVVNRLIGSNQQSLEAVFHAMPKLWHPEIINAELEGDVDEVAADLISLALKQDKEAQRAFLFGGETTVMLSGDGLGGRNQELALRFALKARDNGLTCPWVFLSGGTDGRDGPTDAAGGLVDPGTLERMQNTGLNPHAALERNDSYHALKASDDLLVTGATDTNVADIQILLLGKGPIIV